MKDLVSLGAGALICCSLLREPSVMAEATGMAFATVLCILRATNRIMILFMSEAFYEIVVISWVDYSETNSIFPNFMFFFFPGVSLCIQYCSNEANGCSRTGEAASRRHRESLPRVWKGSSWRKANSCPAGEFFLWAGIRGQVVLKCAFPDHNKFSFRLTMIFLLANHDNI